MARDMTRIPEDREWLSYEEAQNISGLSRMTLWKAINSGSPLPQGLPAAKVGRSMRIPRGALREFMEARLPENEAAREGHRAS